MCGRNFTQDFSLFRKKGAPGIRDSDVGLLHNNKHGGKWSGDQNSVQKVNSWQGNKKIDKGVTLQEHWVPPVRDLHPADHAARHRLSNFLFRGPRLHGKRKMVHNVLCTIRILCSVAYLILLDSWRHQKSEKFSLLCPRTASWWASPSCWSSSPSSPPSSSSFLPHPTSR